MIIKPKVRGFICTTAHPSGCAVNVHQQIAYSKEHITIKDGPKHVLVIGSSSGYGLSSRVAAAFGCGASTIGVFFEKPGTEKKTGTAGWYNAAAFDKEATKAGLYAKSLNGDAFSNDARRKVIELIEQDLGTVDLVIYSLASPVRKMPETGEVVRSCLKPIEKAYKTTALDTNKDIIIDTCVEPATNQEIQDTVTVMGGQDWNLWMQALNNAKVLSDGCRTVAYSYIGSEITWPIYWHGALGKAKKDLDRVAMELNQELSKIGGQANIAVLKSVVTQASSAIPVMPLYLSICFRIMRSKGLHEGCIEQIVRLFNTKLYGADSRTDENNRFRLDDWELQEDVQEQCRKIWPQITTENVWNLTDYELYKNEFLKLFGFSIPEVDYLQESNPYIQYAPFNITD